ncbi:hypothetical protein CYMTET_55807 [Cymbomonas tetramitiformis]|uniref:Uncharacterized protein n=1 Tax=Cymbomonas tetramitiformis TaxID=36881 RepID=A0AAE0EMF8_9CHLO|nr:hypothetical protein CYMTET_55807 [Cymbomonas tetramitiformis]
MGAALDRISTKRLTTHYYQWRAMRPRIRGSTGGGALGCTVQQTQSCTAGMEALQAAPALGLWTARSPLKPVDGAVAACESTRRDEDIED